MVLGLSLLEELNEQDREVSDAIAKNNNVMPLILNKA